MCDLLNVALKIHLCIDFPFYKNEVMLYFVCNQFYFFTLRTEGSVWAMASIPKRNSDGWEWKNMEGCLIHRVTKYSGFQDADL